MGTLTMNLIYCPECQDVRKLDFAVTVCSCGASKGWYSDNRLHAVIQGKAIPIRFDNPSLMAALGNHLWNGLGVEFTAFVLPKNCDTVTKLDN